MRRLASQALLLLFRPRGGAPPVDTYRLRLAGTTDLLRLAGTTDNLSLAGR